MDIAVGQVWRDTYYDKPNARLPGQKPSKRAIRIIGQEPDGRWLVQTIASYGGEAVEDGRKTKVKAATLLAGYELVSEPAR